MPRNARPGAFVPDVLRYRCRGVEIDEASPLGLQRALERASAAKGKGQHPLANAIAQLSLKNPLFAAKVAALVEEETDANITPAKRVKRVRHVAASHTCAIGRRRSLEFCVAS